MKETRPRQKSRQGRDSPAKQDYSHRLRPKLEGKAADPILGT
jgi:hypothetical protein